MVSSRRDGAIIAWHEVPGTSATPKDPSRRVRYDSAGVRTDSMMEVYTRHTSSTRNTSGFSCARSYRTLRDGCLGGRFPRHSCQATIMLSLWGRNTFRDLYVNICFA